MLRIAISCGEGFSSGYLAKHLQSECLKQHLEDSVFFVRIPYYELHEFQDEVDIAMIMPHIEWKLKNPTCDWKIPLYVIPFKAILVPTVQDFIEDAEDILAMANGRGGKFCFPGEEKTVFVNRTCSHRKMMAANESGKL